MQREVASMPQPVVARSLVILSRGNGPATSTLLDARHPRRATWKRQAGSNGGHSGVGCWFVWAGEERVGGTERPEEHVEM